MHRKMCARTRSAIRRYSSTVEAKGADEQELLGLAANVPWDDRLAQQARVAQSTNW